MFRHFGTDIRYLKKLTVDLLAALSKTPIHQFSGKMDYEQKFVRHFGAALLDI